MKLSNLVLLIISEQAAVEALSQYPKSNLAFDSTAGCGRCIRSGFRFCASRYIWNMNIAYNINSATQNQYTSTVVTNETLWDAKICCDPSITSGQSSKCQATNALRTAGSFWSPSVPDYICSSDFSSLDKALLSCPQLASEQLAGATKATNKCGTLDWTLKVDKTSEIKNVQPIIKQPYGANQPETAIRVLNVENLTKDDKCTYIVRATCDGPGFRVRDNTDATSGAKKVELHYYEYNYQTPMWSSDVINNIITGPNTECISQTGCKINPLEAGEEIAGKAIYNYPNPLAGTSEGGVTEKKVFNTAEQPPQELGDMALLAAAAKGSVPAYYRQIPGSLVTDVINRYRREYNYFTTIIKLNYDTVVKTYNTQMTARHKYIAENNFIKELFKEYGHVLPTLPPRPAVPQPPPSSYPFYWMPSQYTRHSDPGTATDYTLLYKSDATVLKPSTSNGGWGSETAGMLAIDRGSKSFGVFGQGDVLDWDSKTILEGHTRGIMEDFNQMQSCVGGTTTYRFNYLAITVLPTSETQEPQGTAKIQIQAEPFQWGSYFFNKPTKPGSLTAPEAKAAYLAASTIMLAASLGSFEFI